MEQEREKEKEFNWKYIPPHPGDLEMSYGYYQCLSEDFYTATKKPKNYYSK